MKVKKICLALASAFAVGAASQASALSLSAYSTLNTLDVFTAGSTAMEGPIRAYVRSVCTNVDEYQFQNIPQTGAGVYVPSPSNQKQLYFLCTLNTSINGKTQLALRKSSGDSGEGVSSATGKYSVNFVPGNAAAGAYSCGAVSTLAADPPLVSMNQQTCNFVTTVGTLITGPNGPTGTGLIGIADVEAPLLNVQLGGIISSAQLGSVNPTAIVGNVWGVAVTKVLRDKLQSVQGLGTTENEADIPTLSSATLYAIFANQLPSFASLTNASNVSITTTGALPAGDGLYFLRRPDSSGTMTSFKVMFGNTPCASGVAPWAGDGQNAQACDATVVNGSPVTQVFQSTGNLLGCLNTLNQVPNGGLYAVGIAATTSNPIPANDTTKDAHWRWIKINGYTPSLVNAATGRYPYYTEATWLTPKAGPLAPSADSATFLNGLLGGLQSPTIIAKINGDNSGADQTYSNFQAGLVLTNAITQKNGAVAPTYPLSAANMRNNPVIPSTRNTANANSCQPVIDFGNTNIPVENKF